VIHNTVSERFWGAHREVIILNWAGGLLPGFIAAPRRKNWGGGGLRVVVWLRKKSIQHAPIISCIFAPGLMAAAKHGFSADPPLEVTGVSKKLGPLPKPLWSPDRGGSAF